MEAETETVSLIRWSLLTAELLVASVAMEMGMRMVMKEVVYGLSS